MPASAIPAIIAAVGGLATGGIGMLAANKARDQEVEDKTRYDLESVLKDGRPEEFGNQLFDNKNANLTLRPGGRPIIFKNRG